VVPSRGRLRQSKGIDRGRRGQWGKERKRRKKGKEKGEKNINFVSVRSFVIELIRSLASGPRIAPSL
jgi:hypothetical protein